MLKRSHLSGATGATLLEMSAATARAHTARSTGIGDPGTSFGTALADVAGESNAR